MASLFKETTILDKIRYELDNHSQEHDDCLCLLSDEQIIRVLLPRITDIFISKESRPKNKIETYDDIYVERLHKSEIIFLIATSQMSKKEWLNHINFGDNIEQFERLNSYRTVRHSVKSSLCKAWKATTEEEKIQFALGKLLYLEALDSDALRERLKPRTVQVIHVVDETEGDEDDEARCI